MPKTRPNESNKCNNENIPVPKAQTNKLIIHYLIEPFPIGPKVLYKNVLSY